jgi:hypothetical protein
MLMLEPPTKQPDQQTMPCLLMVVIVMLYKDTTVDVSSLVTALLS